MFKLFAPDAGEGGLDFFLEAGNQFAVGGDQRLFGFDLDDDGLLGGEGWNRKITWIDKIDRIFLDPVHPVYQCSILSPDAGEGGLNLFLEAGNQFAVGGDKGLFGFDLGNNGLLGGEGWNRKITWMDRMDRMFLDPVHPVYQCSSSSPQTRARVAWIFFSKRVISSRLAETKACSASISATMACWVETSSGIGIEMLFNAC